MLLRPPFIQQDDVKSQTSNPMSHMEKQKSVKSTSKNKKKQNTIGMRKSNMMMGLPYSNLSKEIQTHNNNGYDSDNGSVHSVNSRKSKGRAKQSTIAIGKKQPLNVNQNSAYSINNTGQKQQYEIFKLDDQDDDNRSVGSHASRNSKKNTVKENSLGGIKNKGQQKVNVQLNYYYNNNNNNGNNKNQRQQNPSSSDRDFYMQQQSKVQIVKLNENTDTFTQPLKYNQTLQQKGAPILGKNPQSKRRTQQVVINKQPVKSSASPFEEITLKRQQQSDEEPVYRLKQEPEGYGNRKYGGNNNNNNLLNRQQQPQQLQQNPFSQRNANNTFTQQNNINKPSSLGYQIQQPYQQQPYQQKPYQQQQQKLPNLQQSTPVIQPQMISTKSVTKSRRNKIFDNNDNNSISNSSNIMNSRSNMEGSFQRSRSKSKSKLGDLLRENREKQKHLGEVSKAVERQSYGNNNVIKAVQMGYSQQQKKDQLQRQKQQQRMRYENNNQNYSYNNNMNNPLSSYNNNNNNINTSVNTIEKPSRLGGQKLQQNHLLKPQPQQPIINRKSIQSQQFDLGESNLQLNLSMSHKVPQQPQSVTTATGLIKGDSVLFNFQPQKKKGISITSKDNINNRQSKSIQSKKHLDRLMKKCQQNQQFLAKSILSNNSQLRESSKRIGSVGNNTNNYINVINSPNNLNPNIMKRQETLTRPFEKLITKPVQMEQKQPEWHQMVKNDPAFQIKSVQRKQIVRRPSQQNININYNNQQKQLQQIQTKPMSPAEFFRLENQQQYQQQQQFQQQQNYNLQKNINPLQQQQQQFQQQDKRIHQQQKNRILAQINKKSKPQLKQNQIIYQQQNNINQSLSNKHINNNYNNQQPPHNYNKQSQQYQQEEINLNYSDAQDFKDKQKYINKNNNQQQYGKQYGKQYMKDHVQSSSLSHQLSLSQNGSQRSNSQSAKKLRKKQSSLNIMKKHKVQVREQQPRAQESFYQQPPQQQYQQQYQQQIPLQQNIKYKQQVKMTKVQSQDNTDRTFKLQQSKTKIDYKKPNLINFQENEIEQEKIKSKTDMNFYNYGQGSQRSIRVPSSKPPLSRKSNCSSSKSKSKAKESTLNINPVKKETKIKQVSSSNQGNNNLSQQQQPKKKKTLLQIAQEKQYEGSAYGGSDSQCSFNSRQSFGSVNSKNSRRSSTSKKQSTLPITIKNNNKSTTMNQFRPSLNKLPSSINSQVQIFSNNTIIDNQSIYNSLKQQSVRRQSRERERNNTQQQFYNQQTQQQFNYPRNEQRTIVSKDTYYIDQRGRLVKQDLIIKGNQIYSQPSSNRSAQQMAMQRMRRSREHHRSRSKSRDGSRSRLSKKTSQSSMSESGCQSMGQSSSSNYYNTNNKGSTQYGSSQYGQQYGQQQQRQGNLYIEEFIKPIQQQPSNRGRQLPNQHQQSLYRFQKPSYSNNNQRKIEQQFYESEYNQQQQYYESQYSYQQQNDQYEEYQQEEPQIQRVTLNQLFGRNQKNNNTKHSNNNNNNNNYYYQQQQNNNYTQGSSRRQQYGGNSRYNPQQSALKQSTSRKKSLSRTEKTFYNK